MTTRVIISAVQDTRILSTGPCSREYTEQRASDLLLMLRVILVQYEEGRTAGSEQKFRCYSGCPVSLSPNSIFTFGDIISNSCCLLNQNTAYVITADHNYCHHFLFLSVGVNCYTFTCFIYVQLTKGLRQLRKCKKTYKPVWALL